MAEQVFNNGSTYFNALISDINNATTSIDLETYIFSNDILGKRMIAALCAAAKRGVKVRVLVDGCGSPQWGVSLARLLEKSGAHTRIFHPFPWQLWNWSRSVVKLPIVLKWIYLLLKSNARNHRKVCLIDHHIAYAGSLNIDKCHLLVEDGGDGWRDTAVRVSEIAVPELKIAFESAWMHITIKERLRTIFFQINQNPIARLNYSRHRRRILYKNLLRRIQHCKERIWITNAYFVPDNYLLRRIKEAAERGVDVRILLPQKSDFFIMPWTSSTFYNNLLQAGVKIYEYLPNILHAKTLILDNWMLVGSSNLNHRSLLHDLEADINLTANNAMTTLEQQFHQDLDHASELTHQNWWQKRPWIQRMFGRLFLYVKYWI